jgi:serine protease inhibitor
MVPLNDNTTDDVIDQMTPENLDYWFSGFYLREALDIHLPAFRFEYEKSLNEILSTLGMAIAFTPGEADFSKINPFFELFISEVKHKTFVEVNEEGTEAAAVTSVTISLTSVGPSNLFEANRPFLFLIKENTSNALIFMGKVALPVIEG